MSMSGKEGAPVKKVLAVLQAGDAMPSGYLRGLIYKEHFARHGFAVRFVDCFSPRLIRLSRSRSPFIRGLMALGFGTLLKVLLKLSLMLSELEILWSANSYAVIYMSKVVSYSFVRKVRRRFRGRMVLDFGDAVWLNTDADQFNEMLKLFDAVTTDNPLTRDYVLQFNPNCTVIPDCSQVEFFDEMRGEVRRSGGNEIVLGWVGNPNTAYNLYAIWEPLERLFAKYPNLHLRLLGTGNDPNLFPPFEKVRHSGLPYYDREQMVEEVLRMDIGLFPLQDTEASVMRGILKASVYMSGEAAVIASPVGQIKDLIEDGVNGMLAQSAEEWERKLEQLIVDAALRKRITDAGLELMRSGFTVERSFRKLAAALNGEPGIEIAGGEDEKASDYRGVGAHRIEADTFHQAG